MDTIKRALKEVLLNKEVKSDLTAKFTDHVSDITRTLIGRIYNLEKENEGRDVRDKEI